MKRLKVKQVDVFTRTPLSGNPAAVVLNDEGLKAEEMQAIAKEMNLSETTFVLPPNTTDAHYWVRIFTPRSELPFAGHPTIATVHAVVEDGRIFQKQVPGLVRQECGIGTVPIAVEKRPEGLFYIMTQAEPRWTPVELSRKDCARMLGCHEKDVVDLPVEIVSTGVKWLIIPLRDLKVVETMKPDMVLIEHVCKNIGALGITTFCLAAQDKSRAVHARTFAPGEGVLEDPVCGSGQGSIAAYIAKHGLMTGSKFEYLAEQGLEIGRPGTVTARTDLGENGKWTIQIGGQAVTVLEGEILL